MSALKEYKIANMNSENLEKGKLTVRAILQHFRRVEGKLRVLKAQNKMLKKFVEDMITGEVEDRAVHLNMADRILNSAKPQFASSVMHVSKLTTAQSEKEVSDLYRYGSGSARN